MQNKSGPGIVVHVRSNINDVQSNALCFLLVCWTTWRATIEADRRQSWPLHFPLSHSLSQLSGHIRFQNEFNHFFWAYLWDILIDVAPIVRWPIGTHQSVIGRDINWCFKLIANNLWMFEFIASVRKQHDQHKIYEDWVQDAYKLQTLADQFTINLPINFQVN